jgi:hypothetical protein
LQKHGVSEQMIYALRKRFGALEAVNVKRLRQLEQENGKLKKLLAERDLEIDVMKEVSRTKWCARAFNGSEGTLAGHRLLDRGRDDVRTRMVGYANAAVSDRAERFDCAECVHRVASDRSTGQLL